ncbi:hypothetical protein [Oceanobacillus alkalisoli]|uniref:hypothetical protein n=1 Tax=Oceanobacillus alkalisoli TaxID=2925113 RepID=UPI001EEFF9BF|nr:hypothetical protein [Oceanobacillus alkalisoli]MCF3944988.1 hypothetical protein [Oceanobacillus alkalisoli]MCG5103652.1 hypothetical protein [Oceanobacillus alkalisoli]
MDKIVTEAPKIKPIELKPLEELEGFNFDSSDAFVCDMETGICGPVKKEEKKK